MSSFWTQVSDQVPVLVGLRVKDTGMGPSFLEQVWRRFKKGLSDPNSWKPFTVSVRFLIPHIQLDVCRAFSNPGFSFLWQCVTFSGILLFNKFLLNWLKTFF